MYSSSSQCVLHIPLILSSLVWSLYNICWRVERTHYVFFPPSCYFRFLKSNIHLRTLLLNSLNMFNKYWTVFVLIVPQASLRSSVKSLAAGWNLRVRFRADNFGAYHFDIMSSNEFRAHPASIRCISGLPPPGRAKWVFPSAPYPGRFKDPWTMYGGYSLRILTLEIYFVHQ